MLVAANLGAGLIEAEHLTRGRGLQPFEACLGLLKVLQDAFGIEGAIDDNPQSGWAISPQLGRPQTATFL